MEGILCSGKVRESQWGGEQILNLRVWKDQQGDKERDSKRTNPGSGDQVLELM